MLFIGFPAFMITLMVWDCTESPQPTTVNLPQFQGKPFPPEEWHFTEPLERHDFTSGYSESGAPMSFNIQMTKYSVSINAEIPDPKYSDTTWQASKHIFRPESWGFLRTIKEVHKTGNQVTLIPSGPSRMVIGFAIVVTILCGVVGPRMISDILWGEPDKEK
jgi:hypothetical protein